MRALSKTYRTCIETRNKCGTGVKHPHEYTAYVFMPTCENKGDESDNTSTLMPPHTLSGGTYAPVPPLPR